MLIVRLAVLFLLWDDQVATYPTGKRDAASFAKVTFFCYSFFTRIFCHKVTKKKNEKEVIAFLHFLEIGSLVF